jgi:hypothetical protein
MLFLNLKQSVYNNGAGRQLPITVVDIRDLRQTEHLKFKFKKNNNKNQKVIKIQNIQNYNFLFNII